MGYRLSGGTQLRMPKMTDANYYALAISVIAGKTPNEALADMGLTTEPEWYDASRSIFGKRPSTTLKSAIYILHAICGVSVNQLAPMLGISHTTIHTAIKKFKEGFGND